MSTPLLRRLSVRHLWVLPPFAALAWAASLPLDDNSFLWHVRAGTVQLDAGQVLRHDPFSFTALGAPWRTQSWLADLGYGWLERVTGGIGWVPLMTFLAAAATLGFAATAVYHRTRSPLTTGVAVLVVAWQAAPFLNPRPVLFSYLLLAALVAVVVRRDPPLWVVPLLVWCWAALHGSFVVGIVLVGLDAVRRRSRREAVAGALAIAAASFTAHGMAVWETLWRFFQSRGALGLISEWAPPDFSNPFLVPFVLVLIGVLVAAAAGDVTRRDLIVLVPFIGFGLLVERNVFPALLVLAPWAASAVPRRASARARRGESTVLNLAVVAALAVFAVVGLARPQHLSEERFPIGGALAAVGPGPLFHDAAAGGYLIYAAWPERLVFIDDRAELYGEDGFRRFTDLRVGIDAEATLADLGIDQALLTPHLPLLEVLERGGWVER
ncbi:MAG: hypothetical protein PVI35_01570, partial [Acidimicrobiia bacterium]